MFTSVKALEHALREDGFTQPHAEAQMWKDLAIHLEKVGCDLLTQANRFEKDLKEATKDRDAALDELDHHSTLLEKSIDRSEKIARINETLGTLIAWSADNLGHAAAKELLEKLNPLIAIDACDECGKAGDNHPIECSKHWYNASAPEGEKLSDELKP